MEDAKIVEDQVIKLKLKNAYVKVEGEMMNKEKVSCRVVVITVRSKSGVATVRIGRFSVLWPRSLYAGQLVAS